MPDETEVTNEPAGAPVEAEASAPAESTTVFEAPKVDDLPPEVAVGSAEVPPLQMPRPEPEAASPAKKPVEAPQPAPTTVPEVLQHQYEWLVRRYGRGDIVCRLLVKYSEDWHNYTPKVDD